MKKEFLYIIILFFSNPKWIFSQNEILDIEGHYYNNTIEYKNIDLLNRTLDKEKLILLQLKHKNGKTSKEYIRLNDTLFLYTEFYDTIRGYTTYNKKGKKCSGYLAVSNIVTGDTITFFDINTYEQTIFLDTLLLPVDEWSFYSANGVLKAKGEYRNFKRDGTWLFYNNQKILQKSIDYNIGEIKNKKYENIILDSQNNINPSNIIGIWYKRGSGYPESRRIETDDNSITFIKVPYHNSCGLYYIFKKNKELIIVENYISNTKSEKTEEGLIIIKEIDQKKTGKRNLEKKC